MDCFTCEFAQDLVTFTDDFARRGSAIFFADIKPFAQSLLALTLLVLGVKVMIDRDMGSFGKALPKLILISVVVVMFLSSPLLVFNWFLWPIQAFAIDAAAAMMQTFSPAGGQSAPADLTLYARLVWNVEFMIQWVIILAAQIIEGGSWWPGDIIQRFFGGFLLLAPWLFIAILQAAYMVEAAFMFALAGIMSPILLTVYIAPMGRAYLPAMLRILLGAALTILFAAIVISFTGFAVQKHQAKVRAVLQPDNEEVSQAVSDAVAKADEACKNVPTINPIFTGDANFDPSKNWIDQWSAANDQGNIITENCQTAREAVRDAAEPPFKLFDRYFITLVSIGFISVLFHLKAKTWATNLAGVQDGPGAAAGVAAVVTGAVGAGLAISKGLIGRGVGGAGNALDNLRNGSKTPNPGGGSAPGNENLSNSMRSTATQSPMPMQPLGGEKSGINLDELTKKGTGEAGAGESNATGENNTKNGGLRE